MRRMQHRWRLGLGLATLALLVTVPAALASASTNDSTHFHANLQPVALNPGHVVGHANIVRVGNQITVDVVATGLTPGLPHAMHIHGRLQAANECPPASADTGTGDALAPTENFIPGTPDGLISVAEGAPFYGPVQVSFTTEGHATDASTAFALGDFAAADAHGILRYHRTFTVPADIAATLGTLHIVIHGKDLTTPGQYTSFLEATLPVACGNINGNG